MRETPLVKISDEQQTGWNQYSPGWKRWEAWTRMMLAPIGAAIVDELYLNGDEHVLDIATGAGEPGLTIAERLVAGKVTGMDIAEGMLEAAAETADEKGIDNYQTVQGDACEMQFMSGTFDAVSCRHGFMFFPEPEVAAQEAVRVLRQGGRLATSVWSTPEENIWVSAVVNIVRKHTALPMNKQNLFKCSKPGYLAGLLEDAGLGNIEERSVRGKVSFNSAEAYWRHFTGVVMPIARAISRMDTDTQRQIKAEVFAVLEGYRAEDGFIALDFGAVVISGEKL